MKQRYITRTIFQNELEVVVVNLNSLEVKKNIEIVPLDVKDVITATDFLEYPDFIKIVAVTIVSENVNKYKMGESDFIKYGEKIEDKS